MLQNILESLLLTVLSVLSQYIYIIIVLIHLTMLSTYRFKDFHYLIPFVLYDFYIEELYTDLLIHSWCRKPEKYVCSTKRNLNGL